MGLRELLASLASTTWQALTLATQAQAAAVLAVRESKQALERATEMAAALKNGLAVQRAEIKRGLAIARGEPGDVVFERERDAFRRAHASDYRADYWGAA